MSNGSPPDLYQRFAFGDVEQNTGLLVCPEGVVHTDVACGQALNGRVRTWTVRRGLRC